MRVCMPVSGYVPTCACVRMRVSTCTLCVCMSVCMSVCMPVHVCVPVHVCTSVSVFMSASVCMPVRVCVYCTYQVRFASKNRTR